MSDYTPTTEEVREMFASFGRAMDSLIYATQPDQNSRSYGFTMELYLDRWLAVRDRELKAQAWDEGAEAGINAALKHAKTPNPYRQGEN